MSATAWTNEQLKAITQSGCNLLVAAAAGAGKTAVLVERIIRKITDASRPLDIDSLLVVTFTNAAAAEMRERIGAALEKALDANPQCEHLQRQLTLLDKASITTLHSFCLNVVKSNFHIIELDPAFRIADETETALIKLDILEELFDEKYESAETGDDFYRLVDCYGGGKSDLGLQDIVIKLFEFVQSHPWPEMWLQEHTESFNPPGDTDLCNTVWGKVIFESVSAELEGMLSIMEGALIVANTANGLEPYVSCLEGDMDQLVELCGVLDRSKNSKGSGWDDVYSSFSAFEAARLPRCGKDADVEAQEKVKAARKEVKDRLSRIKGNTFNSTSEEIIQDLRALYPLFKELSKLSGEFGARYSQRKREKALLDFNDLEHLCLKILFGEGVKTSIALELGKKYEEILVDEYQDSNLIQEVIINAISREEADQPNIFMVGDVKQSIYRFRQARPELFLSKYNTYLSEAGSGCMKILLYKNFRSRPEVINGVNYIFKQIMSEFVGELDYTDNEALNPGAVFVAAESDLMLTGGAVEVDIIDLSGGNAGSPENGDSTDISDMADAGENIRDTTDEGASSGEDETEQLDAIQVEARLVARRIKQLVEDAHEGVAFNIYDSKQKKYRRAEFKDIVILLRTTRKWADVFSEELGLQGIPAFADAGSGYFKTIEIQTVISLLQIIDNPLQDVPLLAVLRSPIFLFTSDELADIRLIDRGLPFFEAMKKYISEKSDVLSEKCGKLLWSLDEWRVKARYMATDELIWQLYTETSYYSYVGILPGGKQRQANLRMLFERAGQYEETSYKGLFNFICFIDRLKSGGGDFGSAKILGENENVVRIMSIHKSKGLEFPIVFVSGCGKKFNLQDMNGRILLHQDLGFGPDLVDTERRIAYPVAPKQAIKYKVRQETLSEEMRILYVAFTRAKEKLIITGAVKDFAKASASWSKCAAGEGEKLSGFDLLKAGSFLDWICPALARHKDGEILRHGDVQQAYDNEASWDIKVCIPPDAGAAAASEDESLESLSVWLSDEAAEDGERAFHEVCRRLDWKYAYKKACEIPAKLSVTELKRRFSMRDADEMPSSELYMFPAVEKPAFMDAAKGFTAAEKGSIMHFIMQHLELGALRNSRGDSLPLEDVLNEIKRQISKMIEDEFITSQEGETADTKKIAAFFRSYLGRKMLAARKVSREVPFTIELELPEVYRELTREAWAGETVLLQGVIDCFIEEEEELILLDYKTDYIQPDGLVTIKERYRIQMEYYKKALEAMTGRKVTGRYLYLFCNGTTLEV